MALGTLSPPATGMKFLHVDTEKKKSFAKSPLSVSTMLIERKTRRV